MPRKSKKRKSQIRGEKRDRSAKAKSKKAKSFINTCFFFESGSPYDTKTPFQFFFWGLVLFTSCVG